MQARLLAFCLVVLLGCSGNAQPTQLTYHLGQEFVFGLNSQVDARQADAQTLQAGGGSVAYMESTVVCRCTDVNATSYLFVMNLYNTKVSVVQNAGTASETASEPVALGVGDNSALGAPVYFQQLKTGEIVKVWYGKGDSPYFINVKAGAINTFQTRVVPANQQAKYEETDIIGVHSSNFVGSHDSGSLNIAKTFNQADFKTFATDARLSAKDIILNANQGVSVHESGYIQSTSFDQKVLLVQTKNARANNNNNNGTNGLDMFLLSHGKKTINLRQVSMVMGERRTASSLFKDHEALGFAGLERHSELVPDTLHDYASKSAFFTLQNPTFVNVTEALDQILHGEDEDHHEPHVFAQMNRLIRYLSAHQEEMPALRQYLDKSVAVMNKVGPCQRVFYILTALEASQDLIQFGLSSPNRDVQMQAVITAAILNAPTVHLADSLFSIYDGADDAHMKHAALLAYGAVLRKLEDPVQKRTGGEALLNLLEDTPDHDVNQLATVLSAIKNAGPSVVPPLRVLAPALSLYKKNALLKGSLQRLVEEYVPKGSELDMHVAAVLEGSTFAFNRSWTKDFVIGGRTVNLDVKGELLASTRLDCNSHQFSYEGLAQILGDVTLFTETLNVFKAEAIYGVDNGNRRADDVSVVFMGRTLYNKPLPQLDCKEHTNRLFHTAPAISTSYIVWVSVIPVVFSASASVNLDVNWGWAVCDTQLSAMLELVPTATYTVQGNVELDLLTIKAGVELGAQVNTQLRSQAYIHGNKCEVGFDVIKTDKPMNAYFESFFQLKECKFWIFNCKWMNKDVRTWWQWQLPQSISGIFNKAWPISA